ncbi:hypothetical protein SDC9_79168 [bioreactor metagenome]|uniref:Uncharacterized protein n=1 Tax=bioreactor metagenome TaxID=1076179 RepID=A0A644Z388_9ZZZZ
MALRRSKKELKPNRSGKGYHRAYGFATEMYGRVRPHAQHVGVAVRTAHGGRKEGSFRGLTRKFGRCHLFLHQTSAYAIFVISSRVSCTSRFSMVEDKKAFLASIYCVGRMIV